MLYRQVHMVLPHCISFCILLNFLYGDLGYGEEIYQLDCMTFYHDIMTAVIITACCDLCFQ